MIFGSPGKRDLRLTGEINSNSHFNAQVKGLDLRDLTNTQFNHFGRLMDSSFQVPRELQDMAS